MQILFKTLLEVLIGYDHMLDANYGFITIIPLLNFNNESISQLVVLKTDIFSTWQAYSIYGMMFLSAILLIRRIELNRIRLKNQLDIEKVETVTLRDIDKLKSSFFTNISHEFRTPLTLILGQLNNVMSSDISKNDKERLNMASQNANKLLILINQLLDLSKIEGGKAKLHEAPCNMVNFLKGMLNSFELVSISKNIDLKFESELKEITLLFDREKMEKVLYNLISNSLKFTDSNGTVTVSLRQIKDSHIELIVKDTGIGIPKHQLPRIFDRFYQVDSSNSRKHEGSGIGLALAKELIELHDGTIDVESEPGKGTEFIINLPAKLAPEQNNKPDKSDFEFFTEEMIMSLSPIASNNMRHTDNNDNNENKEIILIVDDNPDIREYIKDQLNSSYYILEANDGLEGLTIAQECLPDLIISDLMMPRMDGNQLCQELRKDERTGHIPIILLTAKAGMDSKIEGLESGIDDFIVKPFNEKELKARIKNLIHQRSQLRKRFRKATVIKPSEVTAVAVDQKFLKKTIETIEENFEAENFNVEVLAEQVNMSVSQLNRKLNALINQPAGQLINSLKLQRASDLLKNKAGSIAEICYKLGFNDQAYFSRVFKKHFGSSPKEYRKNTEVN